MEEGRLNAVYNGRLGLGKLEFGDADEEEEAVLETLTRGRVGQRSTHRSQEQRPKAARLSMEWRIQRERYGVCVGQVVAGRVVRLRPDGARIQLLPGGSQDALGAFGSAWLPLNQAPKPLRVAAEETLSPEELFNLLRVGQVRLFVVRSVPALDGVGAWHVGGEARKELARDVDEEGETGALSLDDAPLLPKPPRRRYDPIVSALAYDRRMQLRRTRQLLWATRNLRQNVTVTVEHATPAGLRSTINSLPLFVPASTLDMGRVLAEHREALREEGGSGAGEEEDVEKDKESAEERSESLPVPGPPPSLRPQNAALSAVLPPPPPPRSRETARALRRAYPPGTQLSVALVDIDYARQQVLGSFQRARGNDLLRTLRVGSLVEGAVRFLTPAGALVAVGATRRSGFLHVSNISRARVPDLAGVLAVGDRVRALVLGFDASFSHISLSTAELEEQDGDMLRDPAGCYGRAEEAAAAFRERLEELQSRGVDVYGDVRRERRRDARGGGKRWSATASAQDDSAGDREQMADDVERTRVDSAQRASADQTQIDVQTAESDLGLYHQNQETLGSDARAGLLPEREQLDSPDAARDVLDQVSAV